MRRCATPILFGLLIVTFWRPAWATSASLDDGSHESVTAPAGAVTILFVGTSSDWSELQALLRELLGRDAIDCHFARAARFDADDLFSYAREPAARVFIRLENDALVRLYFRSAGGERFLLRTLALENGLDGVGRERVGQVVESSLSALLHSPEGLSSEQARAEIAREGEPERTSAPAAPARPRDSTASGGQNDRRAAETPVVRKEFALGAGYALAYFGPDFDLAHGPSAELWFGLRRSGLQLRARLLAAHFLPQQLRIQELAARLQTDSLRSSLDLGFSFASNHSLLLALGAGLDVVSIDPGAPRTLGIQPAAQRAHVVPQLRPEVRYEVVRGPLGIALSVFSDVSLRHTHYDLIESGARRALATPWLVRPGTMLLFGHRW